MMAYLMEVLDLQDIGSAVLHLPLHLLPAIHLFVITSYGCTPDAKVVRDLCLTW